MARPLSDLVRNALRVVEPQLRLDLHHGRRLAPELDVSPALLAWFAYLHDSPREDEGTDATHGPHPIAAAVRRTDAARFRRNRRSS